MPEILVIADDLTGAADCAAACATHGVDAVVLRQDGGDAPDAQVLAIDAATRGRAREEAAARTAALVVAYGRCGIPRALYKKMDSTLRGHVGAELAATLGAWRGLRPTHRSSIVVLAPAFPATGRITRNGRQHVNGTALPEDLAAMVEAGGLRTACIGRGRLGAGGALPEEAASADVWICDAETEDDLRAIAVAAAALGPSAVWAGSAGLARHAPPALGLQPRSPAVPVEVPAERPILFVVGSHSAVSCRQATSLGTEPGVFRAKIRREALLAGPGSSEWSRCTESLGAALDHGHDVVLSIASPEGDETATDDPEVAAALARFAAPHATRSGGLVLTGGDTARAVLEAMGVSWLRIAREVEPGVPLSIAGPRPRPVVTKAGAFGDRDTLRRCRAAMKARG